ncbi:MAG: UDP-N-acetylglucosamine 2-epimerase (non-hydrolyzing) [Candidatus Solibacter sp.]|nr:UDP-N-acetylglucosamine 2-epimerase (non-hydrolyzing) [Candidatus Solibacter sp.]
MSNPSHIFIVFGTRPEAIKLCPLVRLLREQPVRFRVTVCVTGQHRNLLDSALAAFGVEPDLDLEVMTPNQSLAKLSARILERLDPVLDREKPDFLVVQGDTTTTFAGALAGFYRGIPVGHVEAGLRTGDMREPFPEELNRALTTRLSALHFAPTAQCARRLRAEGVGEEAIQVTGNTGIDALLWVRGRLDAGELPGYEGSIPEARHLILVTAHRRESFGEGFDRICTGLERIAGRGDARIVYPVHPNPNVREVVKRRLGAVAGITLIDPLDYVPFVDLMSRASVLLTDSGGIQEEAPSLGKPVLVMRDKTERQEAVEAGTAVLVGTDPERICAEVGRLLDDADIHASRTRVHNPFGDGRACARIADAIHSFLKT